MHGGRQLYLRDLIASFKLGSHDAKGHNVFSFNEHGEFDRRRVETKPEPLEGIAPDADWIYQYPFQMHEIGEGNINVGMRESDSNPSWLYVGTSMYCKGWNIPIFGGSYLDNIERLSERLGFACSRHLDMNMDTVSSSIPFSITWRDQKNSYHLVGEDKKYTGISLVIINWDIAPSKYKDLVSTVIDFS